MRRNLALWTEAAWSAGLLNSAEKRNAFCLGIVAHLEQKYPNRGLSFARSFCEINRDVELVLQKLTYGGRLPRTIPQQRQSYLQKSLNSENAPVAIGQFVNEATRTQSQKLSQEQFLSQD